MKYNDIYEKVFLVCPYSDRYPEEKTEETVELISTAELELVGKADVKIREIIPATYIGSGKIREIASDAEEAGASVILFDGALSPAQMNNITKITGLKVIDRTILILDIFAGHAKTSEGKLQVKLAQLEYIYPRLKGSESALSRLGGGIGTRGPGETKLETDRRRIKKEILQIKKQLQGIKSRYTIQSERRKKNGAITIAIVGYTNVGKSTLINKLTGSDVLAENKLFATLDPTARKLDLGDFSVVIVDTVGFISDIPTNLIESFKSTLSVVTDSDLILNVSDASLDYERQNQVVESILRDLNCTSPVIKVLNKCDNVEDFASLSKVGVTISAKTGIGLDKLKKEIISVLGSRFVRLKMNLPYSRLHEIYSAADIIERYSVAEKPDYAEVELVVDRADLETVKRLFDGDMVNVAVGTR